MKLHTWWRSQVSFRVRIALLLKGPNAQMIFVDLLQGDQFAESYRRLNPEMVLPTLIDGDGPPLVQSLEILEYLDERYPQRPLLPEDVRARAHVRAPVQSVAADAHPFITPRVRRYLDQELGVDESGRMKRIRHWLDSGSRVLEEQLTRDPRTGSFCCGDTPTIADICLVPHVTSAKILYNCELSPYPTVRRIFETCMRLDAFAKAHPLQQADAAKAVT